MSRSLIADRRLLCSILYAPSPLHLRSATIPIFPRTSLPRRVCAGRRQISSDSLQGTITSSTADVSNATDAVAASTDSNLRANALTNTSYDTTPAADDNYGLEGLAERSARRRTNKLKKRDLQPTEKPLLKKGAQQWGQQMGTKRESSWLDGKELHRLRENELGAEKREDQGQALASSSAESNKHGIQATPIPASSTVPETSANGRYEQARRPNKNENTSIQPPAQLPPDAPSWKIQKLALSRKFAGESWSPRRKLSPDAQKGIRDLHASNPDFYTTPVLADQFKVSPEAIRRILKSNWMDRQGGEKMAELRERWAKRHDRIWDQQAELGLRPGRRRRRRVEGEEEGRERVEGELWRREILERAREG